MAATKSMILMFMIASFVCAALALFLFLMARVSLLVIIPGFVVGAFFAFKYAMYDRTKSSEEHKRTRKRNKH